MKFLLVLSAILIASQAISDDDVLKTWKEYQVKFEKSYKSPIESRRRLAIFRQNLQKIEAHNQLFEEGKETYQQGLTPFTDWTSEEFSQYVNKYKMPLNKTGQLFTSKNINVPASVDWRTTGAVTEVKNQGSCGSCWSFSSTGALEGAAFNTKGLRVSLSEQNLVDCAGAQYGESGCDGGNMDGAFLYVQSHGITTEQNYPYRGVQGSCRASNIVLVGTGGYDVNADEQSLQEAVASVGPIAVAIEATDNLQNYVSGVIYDRSCTDQLNHGVLAVGYGTQGGQDYWLIKNSWGATWGEAGYFKLARNRGNNCGVASMASFPTV